MKVRSIWKRDDLLEGLGTQTGNLLLSCVSSLVYEVFFRAIPNEEKNHDS